MANTIVADMQLPENWNSYIVKGTTEKSVFFTSGAVASAPDLAITKGGKTIEVPHFNPLVAPIQYLSDSEDLVVNKITTGKQTGVINARAQAFSVNDLAAGYSGTDPLGYIASQWGTYWAGVMDDQAIATARGVLAAAGGALTLDISAGTGAAAKFSASAFIDANHKLGDARSKLTTIVAHSDVIAVMEKADLIEYKLDSEGKSYAEYRGKRVLEADKIGPVDGTYELLLIGANAFGYAEGMGLLETENTRQALAGNTIQITRRSYVLHPHGFSFAGTVGSKTPTDAELADADSWVKVFDTKHIPLVSFKFKL